jgi:endothelin-converting enzyme
MDEERLDALGVEPLLHFVQTIRKLYRGESDDEDQKPLRTNDLTAALAFLHSRGK